MLRKAKGVYTHSRPPTTASWISNHLEYLHMPIWRKKNRNRINIYRWLTYTVDFIRLLSVYISASTLYTTSILLNLIPFLKTLPARFFRDLHPSCHVIQNKLFLNKSSVKPYTKQNNRFNLWKFAIPCSGRKKNIIKENFFFFIIVNKLFLCQSVRTNSLRIMAALANNKSLRKAMEAYGRLSRKEFIFSINNIEKYNKRLDCISAGWST